MATAMQFPIENAVIGVGSVDQSSERNTAAIIRLVHGFATQYIDAIMANFADDAVYCDIMGRGVQGQESRGKDAIRAAFLRQFAVAGKHTYLGSNAIANAKAGFASWTLVLGDAADPAAPRFAGIDEFHFDEASQVVVKKAWLKGIPGLQRSVMWRNPRGLAAQLRYLVSGVGR